MNFWIYLTGGYGVVGLSTLLLFWHLDNRQPLAQRAKGNVVVAGLVWPITWVMFVVFLVATVIKSRRS